MKTKTSNADRRIAARIMAGPSLPAYGIPTALYVLRAFERGAFKGYIESKGRLNRDPRKAAHLSLANAREASSIFNSAPELKARKGRVDFVSLFTATDEAVS